MKELRHLQNKASLNAASSSRPSIVSGRVFQEPSPVPRHAWAAVDFQMDNEAHNKELSESLM